MSHASDVRQEPDLLTARAWWWRLAAMGAIVAGAGLLLAWFWSVHEPASRLLQKGRHAQQMRRFEDALAYFQRVGDDGSSAAVTARCAAGDLLLLDLKRPSEAEAQFRRAVAQYPLSGTANDRLAYLLGISARSWEAIPYRLRLIQLGKFGPIHLFLLCMGETALENLDVLQDLHTAAPSDPLPLLGLAWHAIDQQEDALAKSRLQQIIASHPDWVEAHVKLGQLLLESAGEKEFLSWDAGLPERAERHPGIWAIRGRWAQKRSEPRVAIRCFWEAVRIDPNHERANYQLSQLLLSEGNRPQAAPFLKRARALERYFTAVKLAYTDPKPRALRQVTELAESLGLIWEAYGWYRLAAQRYPDYLWAREGMLRLKASLADLPLARAIPDANPASLVDLSNHPLPRWSMKEDHSSAVKRPREEVRVAFSDMASVAGLNFTYFNGSEPNKQTRRLYEFTGGGVAVLDYDADGWPDIYLTQGCNWPPQSHQRGYLDHLYRNLGNGHFEDVTEQARLTENRFSQGVTVGDFDSDGFSDVYVANIGWNRLYRNNGDGTFTDVSDVVEGDPGRWTTSCLMADLNNDRLPDLYAVNYLEGEDVFERICPDENGIPRSCLPLNFPAAQDQLYVNLGDGHFRNATQESGIVMPAGKGLGIAAVDLFGSGRLDLFVANDAVPNFCFVNRTSGAGRKPVFAEQALQMGLSLNLDGRPEACMGIAVGDSNGNGLLDLFVTNFRKESNTLYLQRPQHLFVDATHQTGLHRPSMKLIAFGTQFLDGELDGLLDLIVANGEVDDFRDLDRPYQMRPQYFRNIGEGHFAELPPEVLGRYFEGKYLGRGLARLDWNRDGLEDVVVSHLDAPAALLTNQTAHAGHFLALKLVGVDSSRDAIGTTVTLTIGERNYVRQLTAGDGYQASNQRRLTFGLGEKQHIDALVIRWPSGLQQEFNDLPVDEELLFIEGRMDCALSKAQEPPKREDIDNSADRN